MIVMRWMSETTEEEERQDTQEAEVEARDQDIDIDNEDANNEGDRQKLPRLLHKI